MAGVESHDVAYLIELVQRHDRPRYYSALFAERALRAELTALHGFACEIAAASVRASDPTLTLLRLAWWRERLDEGMRAGRSAESPALRALVAVLARRGLSAAAVLEVIEGQVADVDSSPPTSIAEAEDRSRRVEAPIFSLGAELAGCSGAQADVAVAHAGAAYGLARRLAAPTPGVPASLRAGCADVAHAHLQLALRALVAVPPRARPVFLPLAVVRPLLALALRAESGRTGGLSDFKSLVAIGRAALTGLSPTDRGRRRSPSAQGL